jgi:hypothetical protein
MSALLIFGIVVTVCLLASIVLITVGISRALTDALRLTDRAHERFVKHTEDLHNRLMAKDWQEYVEIKAYTEGDEGGFYTPEEQEETETQVIRPARQPQQEDDEVTQLMPPGWGPQKGDIPRHDADEERLLAEDFDDEDEPRHHNKDVA